MISLQSKILSRVLYNTTIQKASILQHSAFFMVQLSHPHRATGKMLCVCAQLSRTLCSSMDYSLPISSVCRIFQARTLERVAISYSRVSSLPRDQTRVSCISSIGGWILFTTVPPGKNHCFDYMDLCQQSEVSAF